MEKEEEMKTREELDNDTRWWDDYLEKLNRPCATFDNHRNVYIHTESGYSGPNENLQGVIDKFQCRDCGGVHYKKSTFLHRLIHWWNHKRNEQNQ